MADKFILIGEWLTNDVEMEMRVGLAESSSCLGLAEANFTETPFFMHLSPQTCNHLCSLIDTLVAGGLREPPCWAHLSQVDT